MSSPDPPPQPDTTATSSTSTATVKTGRITWTSALLTTLVQIAAGNTKRYLEATRDADFWSHVRDQFADTTLQRPGVMISKKVSDLVEEHKKKMKKRAAASGIAVPAPTDLEQALENWIALVDRRKEERNQKKVEQDEKVKAEQEVYNRLRENTTKSLSEKRPLVFGALKTAIAPTVIDLDNDNDIQATSQAGATRATETEMLRTKRRRIKGAYGAAKLEEAADQTKEMIADLNAHEEAWLAKIDTLVANTTTMAADASTTPPWVTDLISAVSSSSAPLAPPPPPLPPQSLPPPQSPPAPILEGRVTAMEEGLVELRGTLDKMLALMMDKGKTE